MGKMSQLTLIMDAAEIIEQIKQLPPDEQEKVVDLMRHMPNEETLKAMAEPVNKPRNFNSAEELFAELDKEC